jgi:hypothetical protein
LAASQHFPRFAPIAHDVLPGHFQGILHGGQPARCSGFVTGFVSGFVAGFVSGFVAGFVSGFVAGFVSGFVAGFVGGFVGAAAPPGGFVNGDVTGSPNLDTVARSPLLGLPFVDELFVQVNISILPTDNE